MIKTIAIDDEPLALQLIESYIKKTPFLEFKGCFDNALSAMDFIKNEKIDLFFIDIQMPDLTGIQFAKIFNNNKFIFTTAYEKYALESYKLNAVDYLLKPFSYEEFLNASIKAQKIFELENYKQNNEQIESNNDYLFLKSEYKIRRINFNEIIYIEGLKDYAKVYLTNEPKPILTLTTLKALESKLPESKFMRVHRSYIVNLEKISTIERLHIIYNDVRIPISEQYKEKFQEFLDKNFL